MSNTTTISITALEREWLLFALDCAIAELEEQAQAETDQETRWEIEGGKEELEKLKKRLDNRQPEQREVAFIHSITLSFPVCD